MTVSLHTGSLPRGSRQGCPGGLKRGRRRFSPPGRWYTGTRTSCDDPKGMPAGGSTGMPVCERQAGRAAPSHAPGRSDRERMTVTAARFSGMGATVAACST